MYHLDAVQVGLMDLVISGTSVHLRDTERKHEDMCWVKIHRFCLYKDHTHNLLKISLLKTPEQKNKYFFVKTFVLVGLTFVKFTHKFNQEVMALLSHAINLNADIITLVQSSSRPSASAWRGLNLCSLLFSL